MLFICSRGYHVAETLFKTTCVANLNIVDRGDTTELYVARTTHEQVCQLLVFVAGLVHAGGPLWEVPLCMVVYAARLNLGIIEDVCQHQLFALAVKKAPRSLSVCFCFTLYCLHYTLLHLAVWSLCSRIHGMNATCMYRGLSCCTGCTMAVNAAVVYTCFHASVYCGPCARQPPS